jgi:MFS family permease
LIERVLSDDPLIRSMSYQSVISAFGEGTFQTGSAVFFTQVVGLSAAQVGLGLTVGMVFVFLFSVPLGRLADHVGTRHSWILGSGLQAVGFATWFFIHNVAEFMIVTVAIELAETWMRAGRNAYRLDVFPPETRVRSQAYMRAARNVGYTFGALAAGIALAVNSTHVIQTVPLGTAVILALNVFWLVRMPRIEPHRAATEHDEPALEEAVEHAGEKRSALRNRGFLAMCFFDGVLGTHQVLLNTVIPLWLVQRTNAPHVLLAWLFGTNTVMAVALQVATARGVTSVGLALRAQRRAAACFVASCGIILVTDHTVQWMTIALVWLAHVTVTGAELFNSAGEFALIAELSDGRRRGEYQGAQQLGYTLGNVAAPAVYTYLAMNWGASGWVIIAAVICVAVVAIAPATRAAERYLNPAQRSLDEAVDEARIADT